MIYRQKYRPVVNLLLVLRVIGWLLMIESVFMVAPLITAFVTHGPDRLAFIITISVTLASGAALTFLLPKTRFDMSKRDGFLLTSLVWVFFSIFGMLPFIMDPMGMDISDAFFETMSGFTTTGASVIPADCELPCGVLVWRSLMQWIGGMGIIIFTLAVLPMLNFSGGVQMFNAEVTGITHDKLRPRVSQTAKGLWSIYVVLTTVLLVLFWVGPLNFFESLCQAFSIMSTGGYIPPSMDLARYDSLYVYIVAIIFMFLGGMNFGLIFSLVTGNRRAVWKNEVFRAYVVIIGVAFVLFVCGIIASGAVHGFKSLTLEPLFVIVSMLSSTGYLTSSYADWGPFIVSVTLLLMFFGACAGSTSGGAKIDRLLFLVKSLRNELYRGLHPNAIQGLKISGKAVGPDLVGKVLSFLSLYVVMIVLGGMALTAVGFPLYGSFFTAFSCISNTGLIPEITGYDGTYEMVPDAGKWILSALMLIGRLEVFTVLLMFTPSFWSKD